MRNALDIQIKQKLEESKPMIPDELSEKMEKALNIMSCERKTIKIRYFRRIAIAMTCIVLGSAGSVYAAKNYLNQRLQQMDAEEIKQYYDETQNSLMNADSFSRNLYDSEREQISILNNQYLNEGKFPESEILQIKNRIDIESEGFYFVSSESKFYLPERNLTEEELLELLDFYYERDYSMLASDNDEDMGIRECTLDERTAANYAQEGVNKIFGLGVNDCEYTIELQDKADYNEPLSYLIQFKINVENVISVLVDADDGTLNEIRLNYDGIYSDDIEFEERVCVDIYHKIEDGIIKNIGCDVKKSNVTYVVDENNILKNGTLRYIFELENGDGYIVNYSLNREISYYLRYIDNIELYEQTIIGDFQKMEFE